MTTRRVKPSKVDPTVKHYGLSVSYSRDGEITARFLTFNYNPRSCVTETIYVAAGHDAGRRVALADLRLALTTLIDRELEAIDHERQMTLPGM